MSLFNFIQNQVKLDIYMYLNFDIVINAKYLADLDDSIHLVKLKEFKKLIDKEVDIDNKKHFEIIDKFRKIITDELHKLNSIQLDRSSLLKIGKPVLSKPQILPIHSLEYLDDNSSKTRKIIDIILQLVELNPEDFFDISQKELEDVLFGGNYSKFSFSEEAYDATNQKIKDELIVQNDSELKAYYAAANLYYFLSNHKRILEKMDDYLNSFLSLYTNDEINHEYKLNNGETENFYFNLSKREVAIFFDILDDIQFTGNLNQKYKQRRSSYIKFLNNSNTFYSKDEEYYKIKNIGKNLSVKPETFESKDSIDKIKKYEEEIKLMNHLIDLTKKRVEKLEKKKHQIG